MRQVAPHRRPSDTERLSPSPVKGCLVYLAGDAPKEGSSMLDIILLAIGLGFFALSVGYTIACDRL
jgi:hypothetical protein